MKKYINYLLIITFLFLGFYCKNKNDSSLNTPLKNNHVLDRFADIGILKYEVPGFDKLDLKQKKLLYYLSQAFMSGRDIYYDQNYKHNLLIRKVLDEIIKHYSGDKNTPEWETFMTYTKRFWFSNGIHHHYAETKILPEFTPDYFKYLLKNTDDATFPLQENQTIDDLFTLLEIPIFSPDIDNKRVNKTAGLDLLKTSATNYYEAVSQKEAEDFYKVALNQHGSKPNPPLFGLNGKLVKVSSEIKHAYRFADGTSDKQPETGDIIELVWCVGKDYHPSGLPGLYSKALEQVIFWLEKATTVATNPKQKEGFELLISFYRTGDLTTWDNYNIVWVEDNETYIDYINGFIEVYADPLGYKGYYEGILQITDLEASERINKISAEAQWFEKNSSIPDAYKKSEVKGISAKVITVVMETGASSPSTPIGVNLPNSNWIRSTHGSKSVSLDNIKNAYTQASGGSSINEFAYSKEEKERYLTHAVLAGKLHTDMHEVIGHASGKLKDGVQEPAITLKNYASTMEEARADLIALYYLLDQKLIDIGVMTTLDVGKTAYDQYIRNGLMLQLRRLELGQLIEEDHMRNRQFIAQWVFEKAQADESIKKIQENGKTYFVIKDYQKVRVLFGKLLNMIQTIKSEGDFEGAKSLIENYGVQVDTALHKEVLARYENLETSPYYGFIQPQLEAVEENGEIIDVKILIPDNFVEQMLYFDERYNYLK